MTGLDLTSTLSLPVIVAAIVLAAIAALRPQPKRVPIRIKSRRR